MDKLIIMIKRVIAVILFIIGLLIYMFFRGYNGTLIPYSWVFYLVGIAMWITGFVLFRSSKSIKENKAIIQLKALVDELKTNGEKIVVNLDQCEIKENNYSEEKERFKSGDMLGFEPRFEGDIQFWNGLYDSGYNTEIVDVNQSVLIYTHQHNGVEEKFISKVIPRTKQDLNFKFYLQKNTMLYVDKNNRKRYYFDLTFLNPEA